MSLDIDKFKLRRDLGEPGGIVANYLVEISHNDELCGFAERKVGEVSVEVEKKGGARFEITILSAEGDSLLFVGGVGSLIFFLDDLVDCYKMDNATIASIKGKSAPAAQFILEITTETGRDVVDGQGKSSSRFVETGERDLASGIGGFDVAELSSES